MTNTPVEKSEEKHSSDENLDFLDRFSLWCRKKRAEIEEQNQRLDKEAEEQKARYKKEAEEQKARYKKEEEEQKARYKKEAEEYQIKRARRKAEIEEKNRQKGPIYETLLGILFFSAILKIGGYLYDKYF